MVLCEADPQWSTEVTSDDEEWVVVEHPEQGFYPYRSNLNRALFINQNAEAIGSFSYKEYHGEFIYST